MGLAVSADGRRIYAANNQFEVLSDETSGEVTIRKIDEPPTSAAHVLTDPLGEFVVTGEQLRSPDLREDHGKLPLIAAAFFPDRPFIVGFQVRKLAVASRNTRQLLAEIELPQDLFKNASSLPDRVPNSAT